MEREDDVQLIQRTLSGDDTAFGILLQRYQKSVHALVWRKIGDFHTAEDITQDTFLQAYKKLSTLKNHNQFAGWLYVIADRLCIDWSRKRRFITQSLEDTPVEEIERSSYTHHVSEEREAERTERRRELVKKLLAKLPESERTVVTLYYLGEMTTREIGKFLGVSVGTIKSRLRRGRKRLQEDEELMIQEVLSGVQIPVSLGENVMRQVADMVPTPSPAAKPFLPWTALGTVTVLIALLLGTSDRYLIRFQKPYSFEAQSEPTIEIVDAPIILDIAAKPAVRNRVGRDTSPGKTSRAGTQVSKVNIDDGPLKEADWLKNPDEVALNESHADNKNWITKWYGPDGNYENNEGFQISGSRDLIEEGTKGKLTQLSLSTLTGLKKTQTIKMGWDGDHGGTRDWTVFELDPASQDNMNRGGPANNIDTYAICIIAAPKDMKAVMSPAHDDHAQIWINGEKWYNNTTWTGGAQVVNYNIEVKLEKGANVVLYRCGDTGGTAYLNLHFDDNTHEVCKIYPDKSKDQKDFFREIAGRLPVDLTGKAATTWADVKRSR